WRDDVGARELLVHEVELRLHLRRLRARDARRGAVAPGHRLAVLARVLLELRGEPRALEAQVAVVQPREQLALFHHVARAVAGLEHVALERRGERALDLALEPRARRDAVFARGERHEAHEQGEREGGKLETGL